MEFNEVARWVCICLCSLAWGVCGVSVSIFRGHSVCGQVMVLAWLLPGTCMSLCWIAEYVPVCVMCVYSRGVCVTGINVWLYVCVWVGEMN